MAGHIPAMSPEVTVANPSKFERDRARVNDGFWPKVRRGARRIPFMGELLAAYYATLDPKTPLQVKAVLMGALAYFVLPIDVIRISLPVSDSPTTPPCCTPRSAASPVRSGRSTASAPSR